MMDKKIQDAIHEAVAEAGQDPGLARKLDSWFEAIASGSQDINDKQSANRHLELLYDDTHAASNRKAPAFSQDDLQDDEVNGGEQS